MNKCQTDNNNNNNKSSKLYNTETCLEWLRKEATLKTETYFSQNVCTYILCRMYRACEKLN